MHYRRSHYLEHLISYSKKDTIHQINFYLILTPGSRKSSAIMFYYGIKLKRIVLTIIKKILEVC